MNIEESKSLLGWVSLNKLYIDTHNECDYHNIHTAIETLLTAYEEKCKELKKERQDDLDVRNRWGLTLQELEKEKEKNKEIESIVNKLMPLAECSYWNYENHTCSHTCRGCDGLNDTNKRTSSGIIIDKDRYCRLYEDGYAKEDTKFVNVEDLINRHLKEE